MTIIDKDEYKVWISEIKEKISSAQIKASLSVNREMLGLYWEIGKSISEKLGNSDWGSKIIETMSKDLQKSFQNLEGFSKRNLMFMRQWFDFYQMPDNEVITIMKQVVSQLHLPMENPIKLQSLTTMIPWGHNILIIQKSKTIEQAVFYILKTIQNNWSRAVLGIQIESQLFERQGKAINNFQITLPQKQSELAKETLKDPYKLDFLTLSEKANGKDIEDPTIGILLCKSKDKIEAEYALRGISQPIGIAEYQFSKAIPENFKSQLPTIQEIENELNQ